MTPDTAVDPAGTPANTGAAASPMRILIITDAWYPQVNGVVRTLDTVGRELKAMGHSVGYITPQDYRTLPCPTYPEIRLSWNHGLSVGRRIREMAPDAVHIATEGPLGLAARVYCGRRGIPFTTSFHTRFPEYIHIRFRVPLSWTYGFMRWFHGHARSVMVATDSIQRDLEARGIGNIRRWTRGVDLEAFQPYPKDFLDLPRPILLYVGRVAVEKNIEAFLRLEHPGSKLVVGGGPQMESLQRAFPDVTFVGPKHGEELARHYAASDVFVFPSLTDTFGNVILEALACGVPVAAYPAPGPIDILTDTGVGVLDEDLAAATRAALDIPGDACRAHALTYAWSESAGQFHSNLAPITGG